MDMLRFDKFTGGALWLGEYGNPAREEDFRNLLSYSLHHNVKPARHYPAILVTTGEVIIAWCWPIVSNISPRCRPLIPGHAHGCCGSTPVRATAWVQADDEGDRGSSRYVGVLPPIGRVRK